MLGVKLFVLCLVMTGVTIIALKFALCVSSPGTKMRISIGNAPKAYLFASLVFVLELVFDLFGVVWTAIYYLFLV